MNFNVTKEKPKVKKQVMINQPGFGKAGNQAIQIMVAQGHFDKEKKLSSVIALYKEITKTIYKADLECLQELEEELL